MSDAYDVVVIGGGIHGTGVAQAAACAGYSVLLLEQHALASGTSSRSSKLIHGGLRYLERHDFGLVRESLRERDILLNIAPDLVHLRPFHIPVYQDTSRRPLTLRTGLTLYAFLGGLNRASRFRKLAQDEWDALDGLDTRKLQVVYQYFDAQTNDVELTRAIMHSATAFGAMLSCPSEFLSARIEPHGCEVLYRDGIQEKSCRAQVLVNAGGPWVDTVAERIDPTPSRIAIDLVQGTHLVLDGRLEKGCYYLEAPQDRRAIFLLPWGHQSLLGTTESLYRGDPLAVTPQQQEVDYLLEAVQHYFPQRTTHIDKMFAGVRVLPAGDGTAFRRSRETRLPVDDHARPRVLSIVGGKLTGYRATAQKVMHSLRRTLPVRKPRADTSTLALTPAP